MRESLDDVTKLNADLKEKLIFYQLKYGEKSSDSDLIFYPTSSAYENQRLSQKDMDLFFFKLKYSI